METTYTKAEANRIAFFGSRKMETENYGLEQVGGSWLMTTPDGSRTYWVATTSVPYGTPDCDCAFFKKCGHHICKHVMFARELEKKAAEEAAEDAEYLRWIDSEIDAIDNRDGIPHPHLTGLGV